MTNKTTMPGTTRPIGILARMTTDQKIGQVLMAPLDPETYETMIRRFHCGSLIVWSPKADTQSVPSLIDLINEAQTVTLQERGIPFWMHGCISGLGWRPAWLASAARNVGTDEAREAAAIFGRRWRAVGLHNLPEPFLNVPLFPTGIMLHWVTGNDPDVVARYGLALTRGLVSARCGSMAQHFPAHGATPLDSHRDFPVVSLDRETLMRNHLASYKACFEAGCTTICTAHIGVSCLDPDPAHIATTSHIILNDFLRGELGFRGVTIADAVEMKGYHKNGPPEMVSVNAVNAGCDSICMCNKESVEPIFTELRRAVDDGRITMARLDEAVVRNLQFMDWLGILDGNVTVSPEQANAILRNEEDNRLLARVLAQE